MCCSTMKPLDASRCASFRAAAQSGGHRECRDGHVSPEAQRAELRDEKGCTWQPDNCSVPIFRPQEACKILHRRGYTRVLLVGDSVIRLLYQALLLLLLGEAAERDPFIIAPTAIWKDEFREAVAAKRAHLSSCTHHEVATAYHGRDCRFYFARDTWLHLDERRRGLICDGTVNLEYANIPCCHCMFDVQTNTTNTNRCPARQAVWKRYEPSKCYPLPCPDAPVYKEPQWSTWLSSQVNASASLVVLGWGLESNFIVDDVVGTLDSAVKQLAARPNPPATQLMWINADYRHTSEYQWQTAERAAAFNAQMREVLQQRRFPPPFDRASVPTLDFFNVTQQLHTADLSHYAQGPNLLKAHLLLQRIAEVSSPPHKSAAVEAGAGGRSTRRD